MESRSSKKTLQIILLAILHHITYHFEMFILLITRPLYENWFFQVEKNWGNNEYRSLDYKYKIIFKFKRNWEKLINDWDVKIEKNWGKSLGGFIFSPYTINGKTSN
jgi:hypothetical protein